MSGPGGPGGLGTDGESRGGAAAGGGERAYVVVCAALIGWAVGYALPVYARWPSAWYDPQRAAWLVGARPGAVPIGYYGMLAWACAGAALGAGIGALVRRLRRAGPDRASGARLLAAWTLTLLGVAGAWFTWNNWP